MPSLKKAGGDAFRKDVDFVTKDEDEQVAAGIVMVPDKADLQNDFVREDTLRSFAEQFATFYDAGEAGGGIMHAVFPGEWMELERNEVLDEAEEIGGETVEAGAWVQEWAINNAEFWGLIEDGIIAGYSIGAVSVDWNGPFEQNELEDVDVPDELGDEMVWELIDGIIREVSGVDIPAVPDAMILDTKAAAAAQKRLGDYLGDPDGFVEEALARGHTEEEAERLWDVLNDAIAVDGAGEPGTKGRLTEAAKNFIDAVRDIGPAHTAGAKATSAASDVNVDEGDVAADADAGDQTDKDAAGGDTPADDGGSQPADDTTMSDDNGDNGTDADSSKAKEIAEENAQQIKELTETVETLTAALAGEEPTVEIEMDGETHEVPKSRAKELLGSDAGDGTDAGDGDTADRIAELEAQLESIRRQSGVGSQQLEANADGEGGDSRLDRVGKALS